LGYFKSSLREKKEEEEKKNMSAWSRHLKKLNKFKRPFLKILA